MCNMLLMLINVYVNIKGGGVCFAIIINLYCKIFIQNTKKRL